MTTIELVGMIERSAAFDAGDFEVFDAVHAPGYGRLNDAVREAMALAARHEALLLDPVYTGKAMAGLVAHVRAGRIAAGSRVLFVHTGGLPAIFAYADRLDSCLSEAPWAPAGRRRPRRWLTDGALCRRPRPSPLPGPTPGMPGPRAAGGRRRL